MNTYCLCRILDLTCFDDWWKKVGNWFKWVLETMKAVTSVTDPRDMKQLHDDCRAIRDNKELHDEWIENELLQLDDKPPKTDTPTGGPRCEKGQ